MFLSFFPVQFGKKLTEKGYLLIHSEMGYILGS
jgi:hypothetical protein